MKLDTISGYLNNNLGLAIMTSHVGSLGGRAIKCVGANCRSIAVTLFAIQAISTPYCMSKSEKPLLPLLLVTLSSLSLGLLFMRSKRSQPITTHHSTAISAPPVECNFDADLVWYDQNKARIEILAKEKSIQGYMAQAVLERARRLKETFLALDVNTKDDSPIMIKLGKDLALIKNMCKPFCEK